MGTSRTYISIIFDIGKSIVVSMLFSARFYVIDLGKDVPIEQFVKLLKSIIQNPWMSALLTTMRPMQIEVIEALKKYT